MTINQKLQGTFEDILFENRNKAYGAYRLRKEYNGNLIKAFIIGIGIVVVLLLSLPKKYDVQANIPPIDTGDTIIIGPPPIIKPDQIKQKIKRGTPPTTPNKNLPPQVVENDSLQEPEPIDTAMLAFHGTPSDERGFGGTDPNGSDSSGYAGGNAPDTTTTEKITLPFFSTFATKYPDACGKLTLDKWLRRNIKYPEDAIEMRIEGIVHLLVYVTSDGKTARIELQKGAHPWLNEAAIEGVKKLDCWTPGEMNGKPVPTVMPVPVKFAIDKYR